MSDTHGHQEGSLVREGHGDVLLDDDSEPIRNPGLPPHTPRPTDVDERAAKRAERQVAAMFGLSSICAVLFVVAYFMVDRNETVIGLGAQNVALGSTLGGALLFIGIGLIQWSRKLMADHEIIELRHPARSSDEDREETVRVLSQGLEESAIGRRPMILYSLLGAVGVLVAGPTVVLLRDLGPTPNQVAEEADYPGAGLEKTVWDRGVRVVRDVVGTPIRPADLEVGDLVNAEPETLFTGGEDGGPLEGLSMQVAKSKGAVVIVRMDPDDIKHGEGREGWTVEGITCYSKICTHVGCPISLYERKTHLMLCPCHQSTFDLADSAKVVFGPAARALPQLPLMVDDEGYLVAQSDFTEPVGPSYWERDSEASTTE